MITQYRYLKHGQPIPKGWRLASKLENTPHGHYSVLIKAEKRMANHPKAEKRMANHPKAEKRMANHPRRSIIKDWPKHLKGFRRKHQLTQKQLADNLQVSCRVVENWESGINKPAAYLKKALKELECELKQ